MDIEKIDNELYTSIYGKPKRGNAEEIWNRIKNDKGILREAVKVVRDKFNERDIVKGLTICDIMLSDYKEIDKEAYDSLIETVYSNEDVARIVMCGASNGGFSYLLMSLFNHGVVLTQSQKDFAANEAMNKIGTTRYLEYKQKYFKKLDDMGVTDNNQTHLDIDGSINPIGKRTASIYMSYIFDSMDRRQAHGTGDFDIRYHILRNPNWTREEKQKLVMDFWYNDEEYKEYLNGWEWGIVNDEANYKNDIIPLFPIECLYDVKYETLLKFYGDKETTDRIWEEIKFCELIRELRPPKYEDEYHIQKRKRA
ncbi:MAG: hypothetical protein IJE04_03075 [Bacilli bacterium]|nr:hypothetical protein [Bacilli bacterium]